MLAIDNVDVHKSFFYNLLDRSDLILWIADNVALMAICGDTKPWSET